VGLAGEVGEVADCIKKHIRGDKINRFDAILELGDVLYYLTAIAQMLGYNLADVMQSNVDKLNARAEEGTLR
jgi:NTP pyrophosphatase (non-canonical NTP hydrolase)